MNGLEMKNVILSALVYKYKMASTDEEIKRAYCYNSKKYEPILERKEKELRKILETIQAIRTNKW